jgi:hypothetical protein
MLSQRGTLFPQAESTPNDIPFMPSLSELATDYFAKRTFFHFVFELECVGNSFAYVAQFVFLRDVWIRIQRAAVASRRATNLATHLPTVLLATHLPA